MILPFKSRAENIKSGEIKDRAGPGRVEPMRSMDEGTMNVPYLLAQYLFSHAKGRKQVEKMSGGHFVTRLADHFGLLTEEKLLEYVQADPTPVQAPQTPPTAFAPRTMPQRMARLEEEVHDLYQSIVGLRGLVNRSITDQSRFATWMISCIL
nr:hypothetical protein [Tanacetum cinerariifolium]